MKKLKDSNKVWFRDVENDAVFTLEKEEIKQVNEMEKRVRLACASRERVFDTKDYE